MRIDIHGEIADWVGYRALDRHGVVVGTVVDVYADSQTGRPKWLVISTGYFGTRRTVAPVQAASRLGDDVVVAHSKDVIVATPLVHPFTAICPAAERSVSAHYARHGPASASPTVGRQQP